MRQRKWTCDRCGKAEATAETAVAARWKAVTVTGWGFDLSSRVMDFCPDCARDICQPLPPPDGGTR